MMVSRRNKILLGVAMFWMGIFFVVKSLVAFGIWQERMVTDPLEYICFIAFCPPFFIFLRSYIRERNEEFNKTLGLLQDKNSYLEHAAKILRHDMHSGINVYIPRGLASLERRIPDDVIKNYKLESPLKLLKEGLSHTQKVYRGVYEFTNLVKQGESLKFEKLDLKKTLEDYLESTSYRDQVIIDQLGTAEINEPLFCTAIDNLIRNGLKYNDSDSKMVAIYMMDDSTLCIQDNGRGMTQEEMVLFAKTNTRKENQKEKGSGLGLGICIAILNEHKFKVTAEKLEEGTKIKIKIK